VLNFRVETDPAGKPAFIPDRVRDRLCRDRANSAGCSAAGISSSSAGGTLRSRSIAQPTAAELRAASKSPRCLRPAWPALSTIGSSIGKIFGISAGSIQTGGAFFAASSRSMRSFSASFSAALRALFCAISSTTTAIAATAIKNTAIEIAAVKRP